MNNLITLSTNNVYKTDDFYLTNLLNNERLLNELEMKNLPNTFLKVFGVKCEDSYKPILLKKIDLYDKSSDVNSFIYKGNSYWLDKQQRSCMKTIAESSLSEIEILLGDESIYISSEVLKQFILQLEVYAYKCYVVTMKHINEVHKLQEYKDILNYDYTSGYPEKIVLE